MPGDNTSESASREIAKILFDWEVSPPERQNALLKLLATKIPWHVPVIDAFEEVRDPYLRSLARSLTKIVTRFRVRHSFLKIALKGNTNHYRDLEEAVIQLSSLAFPEQDVSKMRSELDRISIRISELFTENEAQLTDELKVTLMRQVMFEEEGFVGNLQQYNEPGNSYLFQVLRTRMGIPISLAVIYILVGHRLELPIYGTNIPLHFLLQYDSGQFFSFIDPFHGGVLLDRLTCEKFLEENGYSPEPKYFSKASTLSILKRMCRNLLNIYRENKSKEMEELVQDHLKVLESRSTPAE